jgi:uncharacterized protein (TIGR04255 family)
MGDGENFPNPPIRLVSFELRFPVRRRVATRPVWDAFEEAFAADLPSVELLVREDDDLQLPTKSSDPVLRRTTAKRDRAVTLRYGAVTVEMTSYTSYEKLRACISAAVEALEAIPSALTVTRLGLRYINEVRVPKIEGRITDWTPYVSSSLLAAAHEHPSGLHTTWLQGGLGFHAVEGDEHAFLAYGPLPNSSVEPDGVLRLEDKRGPCFLLDIDSFLTGTTQSPVATTRQEVLGVVDRLHQLVRAVFSWSTTEKLREEVFRAPLAEESGSMPVVGTRHV